MLSTDTRFFGAEIVERPGYLYTLYSVLYFSLLFWSSFKMFYHYVRRILVCFVAKVIMYDLQIVYTVNLYFCKTIAFAKIHKIFT